MKTFTYVLMVALFVFSCSQSKSPRVATKIVSVIPSDNLEFLLDTIPMNNEYSPEIPLYDVYFVVKEKGSEKILLRENVMDNLWGIVTKEKDMASAPIAPKGTIAWYSNYYAGSGWSFFITKDEQQHRIRLYLYPIFESGTDEPAGEYYLLPQMSVSLDNPSEIAPVIVDEEYLQAVIHTPISLCMTFMKFDSSDGYSTGLNTVVYELEGLTLYCTDDSQEQYVKLLNIDRIACLKGAKIGDKLPDIIRKMGYGAYEETIFSSSTTGATGAAYELSYDINGLTYTFVTNSNETLVSDCVFVKQTIVL